MKLNLYGNMPVMLTRDPQSALEAATKNYVDTTVDTHSNNVALHMTAAQNAWLDAITVSAEEINRVAGLNSDISGELASKLALAGGTMTGALYLSGDPVELNQAATKNYVDTQDALKVNKAGDAMTGFLSLHAAPELAAHAATKAYVDNTVTTHANNAEIHITSAQNTFLDALSISSTEANSLLNVTGNVQIQIDGKVSKAGDTMTGPLVLSGDPTVGTHAANKQYVDTNTANKLPLAGGTMTGPINLAGQPTADAHAANKQYVDATVTSHAGDQALHLTTSQNTLLDSLTVTADDLNKTAGLSDTVSNLLATKLDLAGGVMTGNVTFADGKTIFVNKAPEAGTELANKAYVDARVRGQEWRDPISASNLVASAATVAPEFPVEGDVYIVDPGVVDGEWGQWAGHAVFFQYDNWYSLHGRPVAVGDRFGVGLRTDTLVSEELESFAKNLVTVTSVTPSLTFVADTITPGSTTLVFDDNAIDFGVSYTYTDELIWVPTNTSVNLTAGSGLSLIGNQLNVEVGKGLYFQENMVAINVGVGLGFGQYAELNVSVDGETIVTDELGVLKLADSLQSTTNDAVTKSGTSVVTGSVTFDLGSSIQSNVTPTVAQDLTTKGYVDAADVALRSDLDTITTTVNALNTDPVTKTYVDSQDATKLPLAGGTMTGTLTLFADPASAFQASTKQYVDNSVSAHAGDQNLHLTSAQNTLLDAVTVSALEINRLAGVTGDIQTQLNDRLPLAGGTMTGPIVLMDGEPAASTHAANKAYVDNQAALKVNKSGDTMTGHLVLNGDPALALHAATKQYVDSGLSAHATNVSLHMTADQNAFLDAVTVTATEINYIGGATSNIQAQIDGKVNKAGDTMTGALTLSGNPTVDLHAATKQYVDTNTTNKLPLAGGTMTGSLILSGAPVTNLEASTKQYVDDSITSAASTLNGDVNNRVAKAGDTMTGFLTLHAAPTSDLHASTKKYVDDSVFNASNAINSNLSTTNGNVSALRTDVDGLLADPVTKNYVDTQDAGRVSKSGDTLTGFLTLHSDPQSPMHPATRQYVDAVAQGLSVKPSVRLASTENVPGVYNNGTYGVNATLTGASNGLLSVDGMAVNVGDRVLLRLQSSALQNGDYVVQQVGNSTSPFILKRVQTADESREIPSAFFYVHDGATLKGTGWTFIVNDPVTFAIGTDDIQVNQFSGQGSLIAGNGLTLNGNTLAVVAADPTRITVTADAVDLTPSGVTPGLYTKVQVDGYGRVITATNPTTLAGYGINDAQPLNQTLTNLAGLATKGIVVLDAAGQAQTRAVEVTGTGLSVSNADGGTGNITITSNATSAATAGTVVARDASGNFSANTITAALVGNASSATVLKDSRTFSITGDTTAATAAFNGSDNVVLNTTLSDTGVTAGAYTKVTVDQKGRITLGENPTTVVGYGIIDAATIDYVNQKFDELKAQVDALHMYVMSRL